MSQTLMVRFGADTAGAKAAMIDLASSVAQSAVTLGGAVRNQAQHVETLGTAMQSLRKVDLRSALVDQVRQIEAMGAAMAKAAGESGAAFQQNRQHVQALSKALSALPAGTLAGVLDGNTKSVTTLNDALKTLAGNPYAAELAKQVDRVGALNQGLDKTVAVLGFAVRAFIGLEIAKLVFDGITKAAHDAMEEIGACRK